MAAPCPSVGKTDLSGTHIGLGGGQDYRSLSLAHGVNSSTKSSEIILVVPVRCMQLHVANCPDYAAGAFGAEEGRYMEYLANKFTAHQGLSSFILFKFKLRARLTLCAC